MQRKFECSNVKGVAIHMMNPAEAIKTLVTGDMSMCVLTYETDYAMEAL